MNRYIKGTVEKEKQREKEIKDRKVTKQKLECTRKINAVYKELRKHKERKCKCKRVLNVIKQRGLSDQRKQASICCKWYGRENRKNVRERERTICFSVCRSVFLLTVFTSFSICLLSVFISLILLVFLSFRLSLSLVVCLSLCMSSCMAVCLYVFLPICLSASVTVSCLSVYLFACLSVSLSFRLFVCQSIC